MTDTLLVLPLSYSLIHFSTGKNIEVEYLMSYTALKNDDNSHTHTTHRHTHSTNCKINTFILHNLKHNIVFNVFIKKQYLTYIVLNKIKYN